MVTDQRGHRLHEDPPCVRFYVRRGRSTPFCSRKLPAHGPCSLFVSVAPANYPRVLLQPTQLTETAEIRQAL